MGVGCGVADSGGLFVAVIFLSDLVAAPGAAVAVAAAGAGLGAGSAKTSPTMPPRMTIGLCTKSCLGLGWLGIAETFSSVTSGTGSPRATIDGVEELPAISTCSGAPSLTTDGVEDGAPGTTKDEACAVPAARVRPSAPRIRIQTMIVPLCPTRRHHTVRKLMPACQVSWHFSDWQFASARTCPVNVPVLRTEICEVPLL